jgi:transcriptional regulator with XRE-family HTH domain
MEDKDQSNDVTRTDSKTVHQRFEVVIKALGLTRNKFAARLGMASTQIYSVINGRNAPSHKMYEAIAMKFPEVNLTYLIAEQGEPLNATSKQQHEAKELSKVKKLERELDVIKAVLAEKEGVSRELIAKEVQKFMQSAVTVGKQKHLDNLHQLDGVSKRKKVKKSK